MFSTINFIHFSSGDTY